jgi:CRISPR-associated protein (TIGR03984 family)
MNNHICQDINTDNLTDNNLEKWLEEKAKEYQLIYLLAHAEDGVIWGKYAGDRLKTSGMVFPAVSPKLNLKTLQQCRIFSQAGEIFLWKSNKSWKARIIQDNEEREHIEESQILWGTKIAEPIAESEKDGFTLLADGSQGLKHAVPLTGLSGYLHGDNYRPIRLVVRHYIKYDENTGIARISCIRLVSLKMESKSGGKL